MTSGHVEVHKIITLKLFVTKNEQLVYQTRQKHNVKVFFFSIIVKMNLFPPQIKIINKTSSEGDIKFKVFTIIIL